MPTAGSDSSSSHLSPESCQTSESVDVEVCQRACEQWLRVQEKVNEDIVEMQEINKSLSQQLSEAESKASRLQKEVEQLKETLWAKTLALDMAERELGQARRQAKEQHALHLAKDQERKDAIKKAKGLQEQLAQLQSENLSLRQQLGDVQNKIAQERRVCELSAQLELESQNSLELRVRNQELQGLVALLPLHLAAPGVDHTTTALYGKQREQRAQEETREKQPLSLLLQTQAAAQARRGESNTTDASWRKQLGQRIRALELDLERARSMQEESALQLACAQAEIQSSEKCNLVGLEIRRCLTKALKK
ncbi:ankyrin repeat domain-containing protein 26-like [Spheniscus humboldti]